MKEIKSNDTGKRGTRRWNRFDTLLILLGVLLLVGIFAGAQYLKTRAQGDAGRVTYTVLLSDVEKGLLGEIGIAAGDTVRSQNGTVVLGSVAEVLEMPHRAASVRAGEVVFFDSPDRIDCYVTVFADAFWREGEGIRVGDIRVAAGSEMSLRIGDLIGTVRVIDLHWEAVDDA